MILLRLDGPPQTRREPLHGRRGTYPHPATTAGLEDWRAAWREAACPHIDGAVKLRIVIGVQRPASHYTTKGVLTTKARRIWIPPRIDISNVVKLVEDALKQRAFGDDSLVAVLEGAKSYAPASYVTVRIAALGEDW